MTYFECHADKGEDSQFFIFNGLYIYQISNWMSDIKPKYKRFNFDK
jgi:hypothetical protein